MELSEYPQTLRGQRNITERYAITLYWGYNPDHAVLGEADVAMADIDAGTQRAFYAAATLWGETSPTLTITDSEVEPVVRFPMGGSPDSIYSSVRYELHLKDREAEGTTP